jgi:TolB protein
MDDDERFPDPFDAGDNAPLDPPRRRGCLFVAVTLLGSSLAAWFVLAQRQQATPEVDRQPTIAPATLVASLPTARPTASEPPAPPAAGPAVNRIVIVNGDGQVETLAPDGQDRRVLTRQGSTVFFQFPAWSPDGRRLAIIGSRLTGGGIYVLPDEVGADNAPEGQVYFSADETPIYLYWSPDGANLAFLANQARNQMGLKIIDGEGARDSRLLATGAPFYWDWSADSQQLLVHSGQDSGVGELALIDVDGQTQAGNLATPGVFQAPGIAPGGRYWAFAEDSDGLSALVVVDTQTGERRAFDQSGSLALGWSPTGDRLAFTNGAPDSPHFWGPLRLLDVAGGQTRVLTRQAVLAFFWSPDGRSIAFITVNGAPRDGGVNALAKTRQLTRLARPAQQLGQNFLTLSVVNVDTGEGLRLLDFQPTGVFLTQFLPFFDQYALSHRLWSPDSQSLVLPVVEETGAWVLVVPVGGGRPFHLARGDVGFWSRQ